MSTFTLDIDRFLSRVDINANTVIKKLTLGIARSVIEKSPVDTGRFKGNWQLGINEKPSGTIDDASEFDRSESGTARTTAPSLVRIKNKLPERPAGSVLFITNNLDYAEKLENGSSQQAPSGVVEITVLEFQRYVNEAVRELN